MKIQLCALVALLLMFVTTGQAQKPAPLIMNVEGRHTINLNGPWQTIIDPYETGYYDYRYLPNPNGYFKNTKPKSPSDLVEYDFDTSPQLNVPGDWNSQAQKLLFYEGTVWYKKSFDYPKKEQTRLFVYFGAANYLADVYLNGQKLGRHEGGFTPFNFEITPLVREKDNFLVVKVDNKRRRDAVPTLNTDWWNYGGLTRDVSLVEVPNTFIQDYFLQLKKGSMDEIAGWVKLSGARAGKAISIEIPEANVKQVVTTDANGYAPVSFKARLNLWSPANPKLYQVKLATGSEAVNDRIGFRSIETRGTEILLNGKPIFFARHLYS